MRIERYISLIAIFLLVTVAVNGQVAVRPIPAAERTDLYLPLLKGKRIAIVANHTSLIKGRHLVDSLLSLGIKIVKIYCPEHGFRGQADAGERVNSYKDFRTGLDVVSLYGSKKKPDAESLRGIDLVIFDLQDVGVRFYTYLSTMHYVMEACAENKTPVMVLDRPNPNGSYVDGPILDSTLRSFVGIHPIPIVHGMTLGELAQMINGEGWLKNKVKCLLTVIPCGSYTRKSLYTLPVKPSPNLPNMRSVYLYPSTGMFEGTALSVGRGTPWPFQVLGHPRYPNAGFWFVPVPVIGASKEPPYKNTRCYGIDLRTIPDSVSLVRMNHINLDYLIAAYNKFPNKDSFFNSFFDLLAGNRLLQKQIRQGMSAGDIRATWQPDLKTFVERRKQYLIYGE
ncbi:exo-beta-N-acetylmuramidase NamZ family protein [Williamwhitmania taraxaci]|uniref:Uncharacterized conserved protein YbbC, DUF1343 family n=1 Tax=Williamwhitmania taraxaci TaxID=1640674 RepID=A0A1G6KJ46_9BACT|nr:DUF1343 domain-containing protein [Williamwhitmania taraxaci]SDC30346.1 Uncharacterized conserved protein YbbC, DUF1343 family [Williamwhitmania taraxaci]